MGSSRFLAFILVSLFSLLVSAKPLYLSYEQRLLTSYITAGLGESKEVQKKYFERMQTQIQRYLQTPAQEIKVSSFDEFLKLYRGEWPGSYSLESDLQLIEKGPARGFISYRASTPEVQRMIQNFIAEQATEIANLARMQQWHNLNAVPALAATTTPDYLFKFYSEAVAIVENKTQEIQNISDEVSKLLGTNTKSTDGNFIKILSAAVKLYFENMSPKSKKQVINIMLGNNLNGTSFEKFESMVLASGPQFQKLLQIIARQGNLKPELLEIFKKLESTARPIPSEIVRELFEAERSTYNWVSYDLKPLGTGSMAQVHKGVIQTPSGKKEVVIRFLKPEMEEAVREDHRILSVMAPFIDRLLEEQKITDLPRFQPVVNDLNQTIKEELELKTTVRLQRIGFTHYKGEDIYDSSGYKSYIKFAVPKIYRPDPDSKLLVQGLAHGVKLDKLYAEYKDSHPDLKQKIVEQIAHMWLEEALYKSGFFHSDLHQGNFLVDFTEDRTLVTLLDFGMGGKLRRETQKNILLLGVGHKLKDGKIFAEAFWRISLQKENLITKEKFFAEVKTRMDLLKKNKIPPQSLEQWVAWSLNLGLRLPYEFLSLQRGFVILNKSLEESGSKLRMQDIGEQVSKSYILQIVSDLQASQIITAQDMIQLGWSQFIQESKPAFNIKNLSKTAVVPLKCQSLFSK